MHWKSLVFCFFGFFCKLALHGKNNDLAKLVGNEFGTSMLTHIQIHCRVSILSDVCVWEIRCVPDSCLSIITVKLLAKSIDYWLVCNEAPFKNWFVEVWSWVCYVYNAVIGWVWRCVVCSWAGVVSVSVSSGATHAFISAGLFIQRSLRHCLYKDL